MLCHLMTKLALNNGQSVGFWCSCEDLKCLVVAPGCQVGGRGEDRMTADGWQRWHPLRLTAFTPPTHYTYCCLHTACHSTPAWPNVLPRISMYVNCQEPKSWLKVPCTRFRRSMALLKWKWYKESLNHPQWNSIMCVISCSLAIVYVSSSSFKSDFTQDHRYIHL